MRAKALGPRVAAIIQGVRGTRSDCGSLRESLAVPSQARSAVVPLAIDRISDNRKSMVPHGTDANRFDHG